MSGLHTPTLFSFIYDAVDDYRAIANKYTEEERLAFLQQFCKYRTVAGDGFWDLQQGWGNTLTDWVRSTMESTMHDTLMARRIIAGILTEFKEYDEDDDLITVILLICRTDFPNGPPTHS